MTAIRVFFEKKSSHRAEISRQEKHLDLSKAAGQPYLAIRPRSTCCTVVCDWQALHPIDWLKPRPAERPPEIALFARQAERHIDLHWRSRYRKVLMVRSVSFGTLTQIDRVPAHLAAQLADELAQLAEAAMRETGAWTDPPPLEIDLPAWDTGKNFIAWCAHCETWHRHGRQYGHRRPHCWVEDSPYKGPGYNLIPAGWATPAILKDLRRRRPQGLPSATIEAARLLNRLRREGFNLWIEGPDQLGVSPFSQLADTQRTALKVAKPQILAILRHEVQP